MATDLSICNTALELVGANSINSFQDETRESRLCNQLYVTTRDTLLQQKRWSFTLSIRQLSRLTAAPAEEYNYQYQLPSDILGIAKNYDSHTHWRIIGDKLHTNVEECSILYQKQTGEEEFPPSFVRALEMELAKIFSMSLVQDATFTQLFEDEARKALLRAKSVDGQLGPNLKVDRRTFDLTAVR